MFGNIRLVHRINVNVCDVVCIKVDYLVGCIRNPGLHHRVGVIAEFIDKALEPLGHKRPRKLNCALDLIRVRNRHNSGNHGNTYPRLAYFI